MRHFLIKPQMQSFPGVAQELPSCICNVQTHRNGNTASLCLVFGREFTDPPPPGVPASRVLLIQEHPLVMASPWWRLSSGGPHHLVGGQPSSVHRLSQRPLRWGQRPSCAPALSRMSQM